MKSFVLAALIALASAKHHHHQPHHLAQVPAEPVAEVDAANEAAANASDATANAMSTIAAKKAADAGKTKKELKAEIAEGNFKSQYEMDLKIAELNLEEDRKAAELKELERAAKQAALNERMEKEAIERVS